MKVNTVFFILLMQSMHVVGSGPRGGEGVPFFEIPRVSPCCCNPENFRRDYIVGWGTAASVIGLITPSTCVNAAYCAGTMFFSFSPEEAVLKSLLWGLFGGMAGAAIGALQVACFDLAKSCCATCHSSEYANKLAKCWHGLFPSRERNAVNAAII